MEIASNHAIILVLQQSLREIKRGQIEILPFLAWGEDKSRGSRSQAGGPGIMTKWLLPGKSLFDMDPSIQ
jgi:hypothetical protein